MLTQHIPGAGQPSQSTSRPCVQRPVMEAGDGTEETRLPLALSRFQLSEEYGFLLPNPLVGGGCATASARYEREDRGIEGLVSGFWWGFNLTLQQAMKSNEEGTCYCGLDSFTGQTLHLKND